MARAWNGATRYEVRYFLQLAQGFFNSKRIAKGDGTGTAIRATRTRTHYDTAKETHPLFQGGNFKLYMLYFPHEFGRVEQLGSNLVLLSPPL